MQTEIFYKPTKARMIERMLRDAGWSGVDMQDLNAISYRYGAIIHRLRRLGHKIETVPVDRKTGHFKYRWIR